MVNVSAEVDVNVTFMLRPSLCGLVQEVSELDSWYLQQCCDGLRHLLYKSIHPSCWP